MAISSSPIRSTIASAKSDFPQGIITTVAGNGSLGYGGDNGQATAADLFFPGGVWVDGDGDLFIADTNNNRVREVNLSTGIIVTVAGTEPQAMPATTARPPRPSSTGPRGVALDSHGDVFIADSVEQPHPRGRCRDHRRRGGAGGG